MEVNLTDALWRSISLHLRDSLETEEAKSKMDRHFPLFLSHEVVDGKVVIAVDGQIQVDLFTSLYAKTLLNAFHALGFESIEDIVFTIGDARRQNVPVVPSPTLLKTPADVAEVPHRAEARVKSIPSTLPLHEEYTFSNFVSGPSNSFAHSAAVAVAKGPGRTSYNPLFIYGGTGLGKTHLMEAIGHYVLKCHPNKSVCFTTAEMFLNDYISALANQEVSGFRERYRKVDLLLIDDIQFIAGKEKIQEEFFNTFNELMLYHKQMVLTSDVAPKHLKGFTERITGRFQQGMVVEIESPSYELRLAILKTKATTWANRPVPDDILAYIAKNITSHVRAIEGALRRVMKFIELNPAIPLTVEIAQHLLKDSIEQEQTIKDLSIDTIMQTVATRYGVKISDILSSQRTQTLVTPRQVAMFLSRKLTTKSLPEIATAFTKTHATVYHGIQAIQKRLDVEAELKSAVEGVLTSLGRSFADIGSNDNL